MDSGMSVEVVPRRKFSRTRPAECHRGHPYNEPNTYHTKDGYRQCRKCKALRMRGYNHGVAPEEAKLYCKLCTAEIPFGQRRKTYCSQECQTAAAPARRRAAMLLLRYGITPDEYDFLLAGQGGACAICVRQLAPNNIAIDHSHITGVTRGILCQLCNRRLLPSSRESLDILARAREYLQSPPAVTLLGERVGTDPILKGRRKKRPSRKRKARP